MRRHVATVPLVVGLFLTSCSAGDAVPPEALEAAVPPSATVTQTTEPSAPAEPEQSCDDYDLLESAPAEPGGAQLAAAAAAVDLPEGVSLVPGVQSITSAGESGMIDMVARICSSPMSKSRLIEVANIIALAVKAEPASESLATLVVSAWYPNGEYLGEGEKVSADFQLYTWDPAAAAPMASNWD